MRPTSVLDGHGPGAPLDGLTRAGGKLVYDERPKAFFKDAEAYRKVSDFSYSLGLVIDEGGRIAGTPDRLETIFRALK